MEEGEVGRRRRRRRRRRGEGEGEEELEEEELLTYHHVLYISEEGAEVAVPELDV